MVPRENKNNAYTKFWKTKICIVVFLKVAYKIILQIGHATKLLHSNLNRSFEIFAEPL